MGPIFETNKILFGLFGFITDDLIIYILIFNINTHTHIYIESFSSQLEFI